MEKLRLHSCGTLAASRCNRPFLVPRAFQVALHPDAHEEGGLACNNDQLLREQREWVSCHAKLVQPNVHQNSLCRAIMSWIKSMGKKLFAGNFNLISTPFPVVMFEPRSYLEKLAGEQTSYQCQNTRWSCKMSCVHLSYSDPWVYPRFLSGAAAATDPVERMKLVMTWFVSGECSSGPLKVAPSSCTSACASKVCTEGQHTICVPPLPFTPHSVPPPGLAGPSPSLVTTDTSVQHYCNRRGITLRQLLRAIL